MTIESSSRSSINPTITISQEKPIAKEANAEVVIFYSKLTQSNIEPGKILFSTTINNKEYVVGKTKEGIVIQEKVDWENSKKTGVFIGKNGNNVISKDEDAFKIAENYLSSIKSKTIMLKNMIEERKENLPFIIKKGGEYSEDYILCQTTSGINIQKLGDFNQSARTGVHIPNDPTKTFAFDGDPLCLTFIQDFTINTLAKSQKIDEQPKTKEVEDNTKSRTISPEINKPIAENKVSKFFKSDVSSPIQKKEKTKVVATSVDIAKLDGKDRQKLMKNVYDIYASPYRPNKNMQVLSAYVGSEDYVKHAQTAKVYYNKDQLDMKDATKIMHQREPVNIAMNKIGPSPYDKSGLKTLLSTLKVGGKSMSSHEVGIYNNPEMKKKNGDSFTDQPNTASVYSETYLWSTKNDDKSKKEISCLSVPAPPLDTPNQPHYKYYIENGQLNKDKYREEMKHLAKTIVTCAIENKATAFEGKGIQRLVISQYGQAAFLGAVNDEDKALAHKLYYETIVAEIAKNTKELEGVEIVMSIFGNDKDQEIQDNFTGPLNELGITTGIIKGDILQTAKDGDMIVNAWDPHSVIGNGNDGDNSLDGFLGGGTGIGPTQLPWINHHLASEPDGTPVDASRYVGI